MSLVDDIAQTLSEQPKAEQQIFAGTINSVSPLTVTLDGSGVALPCLAFGQITLTVSRRVGLIKIGSDLVIVGSFGNDTILTDGIVIPGAIQWGSASTVVSPVGTLTWASASTFVGLGVGVAFKAPPSGNVDIKFSAQLIINTAGAGVTVAPHLRTGSVVGSGTDWAVADTTRCIEFGGPSTVAGDWYLGGSFRTMTGLTPGADYNVELRHRSNPAGNGDTNKHIVSVIPVL